MVRVRLKDICEVSWGDTSKTKASYVSEGYPAFSASGRDGFVSYFGHEGPGIVLSAIGAQCGKTWFTDGRWSCIKNTIYIKTRSASVDPRFVFYATSDPDVWPKRGAAQPFISQTDAQNVEIELPPLLVQRRIAGILSAYDDLIDNNQRRIRVLEDMARALYREWFVHFHFPGHDKVKMVPSALGPIPQGWEVKKLGEIADVNRAQINPRTAPDEVYYIDISSVSPGQINAIITFPFAEAPGRARRIVSHGDILWSCVRPNRRSHALVMQPALNTIASTGFAVLTATKAPFSFLYLATTTENFVTFLTNSATGSAYPAVSAKTFEDAVLLRRCK